MCGIVAGFNKAKDINEEVLLQFEDQSSRGTNGFGSLFINKDGKFTVSRATGQIKAIIDAYRTPAKMMIFHHRMPSSSKNKISQTHPIRITSGDLKHEYYFVHNGTIRNDKERKEYHEKELGYKYSTEVEENGWYDKKEIMYNDSEVLAYDIARFIEGQTTEIKTAASAAFIVAQVSKKTQKVTKIFYGRNFGNPLNLAKTRDYIFLSSEGKGEPIKENMLYSFKLDDYKIVKKKMTIPTSTFESDNDVEEHKGNATPKTIGFNDDPDDFGSYHIAKGKTNRYPIDDDWMTWEEEEDLNKYFNACQLELDNLKDIVTEAGGEELYMIDVEDTIKNIAINLSQGVDYARRLKASEYAQSETDEVEEIKEDKAIVLPTKTSAK